VKPKCRLPCSRRLATDPWGDPYFILSHLIDFLKL
jgi:hypothetical protein